MTKQKHPGRDFSANSIWKRAPPFSIPLPSGLTVKTVPLPEAQRIRHLLTSVRAGEIEVSAAIRVKITGLEIVELAQQLPASSDILKMNPSSSDERDISEDYEALRKSAKAYLRSQRWWNDKTREQQKFRLALDLVDLKCLGFDRVAGDLSTPDFASVAQGILSRKTAGTESENVLFSPSKWQLLTADWIPTHSHPGLVPAGKALIKSFSPSETNSGHSSRYPALLFEQSSYPSDTRSRGLTTPGGVPEGFESAECGVAAP